ncbi:MAG: S9 family peptidase [Bacteroidaceae bacterium]|nr:S9 family peptidase [Bacteroidaceae bacterium]
MRKTNNLLVAVVMTAASIMMSAHEVDTVRVAGPFMVQRPYMVDTVDVKQKKLSDSYMLDTYVSLDAVKQGKPMALSQLNADSSLCGKLMMAAFSFKLGGYNKVEIKAEGPKYKKVFVNGKEANGKQGYQPGLYNVVVKYVADTTALKIKLEADSTKTMMNVECPTFNEKRLFSLDDVMEMKHYTGLSVSPSGKYATISTWWYDHEGKTQRRNELLNLSNGTKMTAPQSGLRWMPRTERLLGVRTVDGKKQLVSYDPADFSEQILCKELPSDNYTMSPTEDFVILTKSENGPDRESGVYEVLIPDDRQPGWRNRSSLQKMDLKTGLVQPLTFGSHSSTLNAIAADGSYIIFSVSEDIMGKRPTEVASAFRLNLQTMACDTLFWRDGFAEVVGLVDGTDRLLVTGSPEAFNRIGCTLPEDLVPNAYDHQLFLLDINTKKVQPVTRDFDPSIETVKVQRKGAVAYFTAENGDSVSLYRYDVKSNSITRIEQPLELVQDFAFSNDGSTLLYYGSSACVADELYSLNTKTKKLCLLGEADPERMQEVEIGSCHGVRFMSSRGYELTGFYYLPPNFDASKKYPVIVDYYGGCSPTSRRFGGGSHYPAHYWNALGYVVLCCNPSGASGFGQEWASRHVNTMGEGVAEDIIETVEYLMNNNQWVDSKAIGCVSASYGGFMTQLLLTKTDMFAAGISHAGISDHTSYWGEGYWGYTYSQVSAANSYPWTRKDLYVDRSPLYNADKIHTPLLFTHGTADTNVPVGESIQMHTALKLLGVPTAFVLVEGENHGIMDFHKRKKWINTMVAWFDKYLKGDSSWWDAIYTPKDL